ncbi:MAG: enhanced serine sensitivity protein SseB C-terminal domain-containing protein [Clostridiales bacterium]|nr:enhanced serine sensitivity protein SseB C-terminal domain-containing protein [Clostridiales bacterium]
MGLFGKKNNEDRGDLNEQNKENESISFPFLTILIEEVLSMTSTEVSVIGNVRGADLKEGQELYLLGRKGKSMKTRALRIEDALMAKMSEAKMGENVSVVLEGLRSGDVSKYDVLSTVNYVTAEKEPAKEFVNPFLTAFLRESQKCGTPDGDGVTLDNREYMSRLVECIAEDAMFLSPCMKPEENAKPGSISVALLKGKGGKTYLPLFTDSYELEITEGIPEKAIQQLDFPRVMNIVKHAPVDGIIINPKSTGFVLTRQILESLELHKRKIDNHIREQKLDSSQPIMIAIPTDENTPNDLFDALKEHMKKESRILRAWYALMIFPKEDKKAHLIVVDTLEETPEVFGAIGRVAQPFLDDLQLNMQAAAKVKNMTEKMMLFYEREDTIKV